MTKASWAGRGRVFAVAGVFAIAGIASSLMQGVQAVELPSRALLIGSPNASATTTYRLSFTITTATSIGSIKFDFCDNPLIALPCTPVAGLDVSAVGLIGQSGQTGFSVFSRTQSQIIISRIPAVTVPGAVSYTFSQAVNPSASGQFFGRITTYASNDGTGSYQDFGGVVGSIQPGLATVLYVPPILIFCVAQRITSTDCSAGSGDLISLGELSTTAARYGTSQMVAATNAYDGFNITASGGTVSAGSKTIAALTSPAPNAPGTSQFGINLVANSNPSVGANKSGPGVGSTISPDYASSNRFTYRPDSVLVTQPISSDYQKFTTSYLVNVPPGQAPGTYNTTITYTCTGNF